MKHRCTLCGCTYDTFAFRGGYVCEKCLKYVKDNFRPTTQVRDRRQNGR